MSGHVLVIDQGTTSTRAIVFGANAEPIAIAQEEFPQIFPQPGFVEHDPEDIWRSTLVDRPRRAGAKPRSRPAGSSASASPINARRHWSGIARPDAPLHNAIVWQDRRTAPMCARLKQAGHEAIGRPSARACCSIPISPRPRSPGLLDNVPGARAQAERGELAFGTVDTFLIWRLTNGKSHVTDATNASRTLLLNIHTGDWDDELLALFDIPRSMLPEVRDCSADFGVAAAEHFGVAAPILGVAGDQQAALIGQACFQPGMAKSTFGTGGFILMNTGADAVVSKHRLLTTIAYQWRGERAYALEGSIFSAGATVQWLRDGLGIIASAAESGALAAAADPAQRVYLVPAFTGLGAPHWNSEARGAITGLTRGATRKEIVRAALESVAYQTRDLIAAMRADEGGGATPTQPGHCASTAA